MLRRLTSRGDVDAITHEVAIAFLDHIAKMNTDPKLDAALCRKASIPLGHPVLQLDGAANSIDHASELNEHAIPRPLNDAAMM